MRFDRKRWMSPSGGMFRSREWFAKYLWHCCSDHEKKSNSHSSPHEHSQWNFLLNYIRQVFWVINKVYHVKPLIFWRNLLLWDDQAHLNYYDLGKDVRCKMATWTNTFGTYQLTLSFCRIFESPHYANINCEFPRCNIASSASLTCVTPFFVLSYEDFPMKDDLRKINIYWKGCNIHWQMHLQIRGVCVGTCVCERVREGERTKEEIRERDVVRGNLSILNLFSVLLHLHEEEFY